MRSSIPLPNIHDPIFDEPREYPGFCCSRARIGRQAGTQKLGVSLFQVPPGEAAYPETVCPERPGRAAPASALAAALGPGTGVEATTGTGGGDGALVPPTTPVSTATSTATPSRPIEQASAHALSSDGGAGRCAIGVDARVESDTLTGAKR